MALQDHKAEYDELQEKKKEGSDTVVGLYRRKELVHKELKQCKEAVKEANAYQKLCDDLKENKTLKSLFDAYHLERQMETHAKEAEEAAKKTGDLEKTVTVLSKKINAKGKEKAEKQKEYSGHDEKVEQIEKKIRSIQRSDIIKVQTSIDSAKADLKQAETQIKDSTQRKKEISKTLNSDEALLKSHEADLKKEEADNVDKDIKLQDSQVSEYNRLKLRAGAETQRAKTAFEKTQAVQQHDQRELNQAEEAARRTQERVQDLESKVANDSGAKDSVVKEMQSLSHTKQKLESDLKDMEVKFKNEQDRRKVCA